MLMPWLPLTEKVETDINNNHIKFILFDEVNLSYAHSGSTFFTSILTFLDRDPDYTHPLTKRRPGVCADSMSSMGVLNNVRNRILRGVGKIDKFR